MKTDEQIKQEEGQVADIIGSLMNVNRGNFVIECGRQLAELCEASATTRKKGKLTITLEILPTGINQRTGKVNQFEIDAAVSIKAPELSQPAAIFFYSDDGHLTRDDPDQMEMELHEKETAVK